MNGGAILDTIAGVANERAPVVRSVAREAFPGGFARGRAEKMWMGGRGDTRSKTESARGSDSP